MSPSDPSPVTASGPHLCGILAAANFAIKTPPKFAACLWTEAHCGGLHRVGGGGGGGKGGSPGGPAHAGPGREWCWLLCLPAGPHCVRTPHPSPQVGRASCPRAPAWMHGQGCRVGPAGPGDVLCARAPERGGGHVGGSPVWCLLGNSGPSEAVWEQPLGQSEPGSGSGRPQLWQGTRTREPPLQQSGDSDSEKAAWQGCGAGLPGWRRRVKVRTLWGSCVCSGRHRSLGAVSWAGPVRGASPTSPRGGAVPVFCPSREGPRLEGGRLQALSGCSSTLQHKARLGLCSSELRGVRQAPSHS